MIAIDPPVRILIFSLASEGPSTHAPRRAGWDEAAAEGADPRPLKIWLSRPPMAYSVQARRLILYDFWRSRLAFARARVTNGARMAA
jgi:hypothetical protein